MDQQTNRDQLEVIELLKKNNVFLTGPAGTGKTFTVEQVAKYFKNLNVYITATTGIAAQNYENATTLHSFAGIPTYQSKLSHFIQNLHPFIKERLKDVNLLIIDEVSMLNVETFELLNGLLKFAKNSGKHFGGCRLLLTGDFFQLPPVLKNEFGLLLFESELWKNANIITKHSTQNYRQDKDSEYQQHLFNIREGDIPPFTLKYFLNRSYEQVTFKKSYLKVFFTNNETNNYNQKRLQELPGNLITYNAIVTSFNYPLHDWSFQIPKQVTLKVGARVMISKNFIDKNLVNGHIATIVHLEDNLITIKYKKMFIDLMLPIETILNNKQEKVAECKGFPLVLAYGLTVHKVQGLTLNHVVIYLNKLQFTPHLFYVAASRVTNGQNIYLIGNNEFTIQFLNNIKILPQVFHF
ncbi:ATP-dependent DNA helicase PIF5-like [Hydra vulgaris]|uniref:ATP-dependent DNA helicase PIF5-like n=1 Tax=Hydra vulgaris TaxID=6087 RepID=UPI0032E9C8FE